MADEERLGRTVQKKPRVRRQGEYREKRGVAGRPRFIAGCQENQALNPLKNRAICLISVHCL